MAIEIPTIPDEIAELLGTDDPTEQLERVHDLLAKERTNLKILTVLHDPRHGRTTLHCLGDDLTLPDAILVLRLGLEEINRLQREGHAPQAA